MSQFTLYTYNAHCTAVYDGDTITVDVDLGFKTFRKGIKIRLSDIQCPEMRGADKVRGKAVRDVVRQRVLGKDIVLHTKKQGSFGRWLGMIYYVDDESDETINLNEQLITEGNAVPYEK